jgi:PGF-pre-PGF domain-containing protein
MKIKKRWTITITLLFLVLILINLVGSTQVNPNIESNLKLLMHFNNQSAFNENDTFVYDFSGNDINGTLSNGNMTASGFIGGGIHFNNQTNDGMDINISDLNPSKNFTISMWIKKAVSDVTSEHYLFSRNGTNNVFYLYITVDDSINLSVYNNTFELQSNQTGTGALSVLDTVWHHVIAGYNGTLFIYLDGQLKSEASIKGTINNGTGEIDLGKSYSNQSVFNGTIDELVVWSKALTMDEIREEYDLQRGNITNCTTIKYPGYYILGNNITNSQTSACINITSDNVTFNCRGHFIDGDDTADYGIYISRDSEVSSNISIFNCNFTDWDTSAIYQKNSNYNIFENHTYSSNQELSIYLNSSNYNNLTNMTMVDSGISILSSQENLLIKLNITTTNIGINLSSSNNNSIINNTINSNLEIKYSNTVTIINNSFLNSGEISDSKSIQIQFNTYNSSLTLTRVNDSTISKNDINFSFLLLNQSSNNTLTTNKLWNCSSNCISLYSSHNNLISSGKINLSSLNSISITSSENNTVTQIPIFNVKTGLYATSSTNTNISLLNITNTTSNPILIFGSTITLLNSNKINHSYSINVSSSSTNTIINNTLSDVNWKYFLFNSTIDRYAFSNASIEISNRFARIKFLNKSIMSTGTNLTKVIRITENVTYVNTSTDINLNQSANITVLQTFIVPKIMIDPSEINNWTNCPANVCQNVSYITGIFKFNVSHFTGYRAANTGDIYQCQNITVSNINYTLKQSITTDIHCLNITAENITINLDSNTLTGSSNRGISVFSKGVTIKKGIIKKFNHQIFLYNSSEASIINITMIDSVFGLYSMLFDTITLNEITSRNNTHGVFINKSSGLITKYSTIRNNTNGIKIENSTTIQINLSNVYNNTINLYSNNSDTISAYYNYWDYFLEDNISSLLVGTINYNPWINSPSPDTTPPNITITVINPYTASHRVNFTITSDDRVLLKYKYNTTAIAYSSWLTCYTISTSQNGDGNCDDSLLSSNVTNIYIFNATNIFGLTSEKNTTVTIDYDTPETLITGTIITGGGGGGGISTVSNIVISYQWSEILDKANYTIKKADFGLTNISFNVNEKKSGVKITFKKLGKRPNVARNLTHSIFNYYEISKDNIQTSEMSNINMNFKIPSSWMNLKDTSKVAFFRYNNGWQELSTTYISKDSSYYYFKSDVTGFSYFAIAYKAEIQNTTTTTTALLSTTTLTESTFQTQRTYSTVAPTSTTLLQDEMNIEEANNEPKVKFQFNKLIKTFIITIVIIIILSGLIVGAFLTKDKLPGGVEKFFGNIYVKFLDIYYKKPVEKESEEGYEFDELKEYVQKYVKKGFSKTEIQDQLEGEGVPKKLITKALK